MVDQSMSAKNSQAVVPADHSQSKSVVLAFDLADQDKLTQLPVPLKDLVNSLSRSQFNVLKAAIVK